MMKNKTEQTASSGLYYNPEEVDKMKNSSVLPKLLSAKEVAAILKIGYVKTLEMMRYGKIPSVKLGNTYRTSEEALREWLDTNLQT